MASIALVCLLSYAITASLQNTTEKAQKNIEYVSYEILTDNALPVSKEETQTTSNEDIVRLL